jgi:hypothetical protein
MSTTNKVTNAESPPKHKIGARLQEFLTQDMKAPAQPSNILFVTTHDDMVKRTKFYGMLEQVSRVDAAHRKIKKSSTSMALLGLGLGIGERNSISCLLKLPKRKLRILGQALGESSKHAVIRKYLDYEQICDRVGSGFNKLSADEQTESFHDIRARRRADVQGCSKNTTTTTQEFTTMQSCLGSYDKSWLRKTGGIKDPLARASAIVINRSFGPEH